MLAPIESPTGVNNGMHRLLVFIIPLSCILISCTEGNIRTEKCPDGEPIFITKNIEDAYPAYVREYDAGLTATEKLLSGTQASATLKTKVVKLRQDLDQERAELEIRQKSVIMALQTMPCDKAARDNAWKLLGDIKTKTTIIPDRVKQLNDDAVAKLESEVSNLLRYPDAYRDMVDPPTITEELLTNKLPRRLFDLLYAYDDKIILSVPKVGTALRDHKVGYYRFRQNVQKLEGSLMAKIGERVQVRFRDAWTMYLQYVILRSANNSKEKIIAGGNFFSYPITWDDCERVFQELWKDQSVSSAATAMFSLHSKLGEGVAKISAEI